MAAETLSGWFTSDLQSFNSVLSIRQAPKREGKGLAPAGFCSACASTHTRSACRNATALLPKRL